jgi:rhodanese-related sulfurtransferase
MEFSLLNPQAMTQELVDLRLNILEGRYEDALAIVDELEGMGKQAILRNIESFLVRLLVHLIKNQVELRLTNSWVASISDSVVQIAKLNLKDNKTSYYIKLSEWQPYLEEAVEEAIRPASVEVFDGQIKPKQLSDRLDRSELIAVAQQLLSLTYTTSRKDLPDALDTVVATLPGAFEWLNDSCSQRPSGSPHPRGMFLLRKLSLIAIKFLIWLRFPKVRQISTQELSVWLEEEQVPKPLLLDARTQEEYEVSHLKNALLVPANLENLINLSTPIVVYCSVGYRSCAIAKKLQQMGYKNVFNLKGSIFQWFNEGRAVYQKEQVVRKVHPYNPFWGYLTRDLD